jgi:hypothetical protein
MINLHFKHGKLIVSLLPSNLSIVISDQMEAVYHINHATVQLKSHLDRVIACNKLYRFSLHCSLRSVKHQFLPSILTLDRARVILKNW